ncbi:unnamed protein product [Ceutorhynchus assimilis]|uniref:PID domain-containing protein n=1 Tax=Ceutorhynchus assimilis TaxID=467358 RepID=A0A9N9MJ35_9CUCU|nr:unnamed protein product [Ceutorhynchus assimilis]
MSFFKIKPIWKGNSKHKKLSSSDDKAQQNGKEVIIETDAQEPENEVATFKLKYLGSTAVDKNADKATISSEAVKNIIKTAKAVRKQQKKLQRVIVAISVQGISVTDLDGNDIFKVSIYKISNCASDSNHRQVFSFISTDQSNDKMECHAFFCSKRKIADTVTLTVGKIFTSAYEAWVDSPNNQQEVVSEAPITLNKPVVVNEEKLIDFDSEGVEDDDWEFDALCSNNKTNNSQWVSFEDDFAKVPPQNNLILV